MLPYRISLITILALAWISLGISQVEANDQGPNFLLVVADDMGWTDIGAFGGEIDTPNLDTLAKSGIKFTDFSVSVSCSPTRSMLLSGNDNHIAGLGNMGELITKNQVGKPGYEGHLNNRVASLAEVLRDGDYHTYMAGKWHLGHKPGTLPFDRGFERSFSMLNGGGSHWADMIGVLPSDDPVDYTMDGKFLDNLPADHYSSRSFADFLITAIRGNHGDGKPFPPILPFKRCMIPYKYLNRGCRSIAENAMTDTNRSKPVGGRQRRGSVLSHRTLIWLTDIPWSNHGPRSVKKNVRSKRAAWKSMLECLTRWITISDVL